MTVELDILTRTIELYRDGSPVGDGGKPLMPPDDMPPLCRQHRCSLHIVVPEGADSTAVHRTAQGHEHEIPVTVAMWLDMDFQIWDYIRGQIDDVHGIMGMV